MSKLHKVLRWGLNIFGAGVISLIFSIFYGGYFIPLIVLGIGVIVTIVGLVLNKND